MCEKDMSVSVETHKWTLLYVSITFERTVQEQAEKLKQIEAERTANQERMKKAKEAAKAAALKAKVSNRSFQK